MSSTNRKLEVGMRVTQEGLGYTGIVAQTGDVPVIEWWKWYNECFRDPYFKSDKPLIIVHDPIREGDTIMTQSRITWGMMIEKVGKGIPGEADVIVKQGATAKVVKLNENGWMNLHWLTGKPDGKYSDTGNLYLWNPSWFVPAPGKAARTENGQETDKLVLDAAQVRLLRANRETLQKVYELLPIDYSGQLVQLEGVISDLDILLEGVNRD